MSEIDLKSRIEGVLLGTAVGDALGLPWEGIKPGRASRMRGDGPWRHRFVLGRGMVSDDTEHTMAVAQCLLACPEDPERFARRLAWCLRAWFLALPAGIGWATLRACVRLCLGWKPSGSGVFSAGNGPAMRSAIIGARFAHDPERLDSYVRASTRLTHTDPKAFIGALAVARLTAWAVRDNLDTRPPLTDLLARLYGCAPDYAPWFEAVAQIEEAATQGITVLDFARQLGLEKGVTGYVMHTVPVVIFAWYKHFGDFERTLSAVIECGGDADTTGAIVGAMAGAVTGSEGIPALWRTRFWEWPRGPRFLIAQAERLAGDDHRPVPWFWPGLLLRNPLFVVLVLAHGFRRLAPPY